MLQASKVLFSDASEERPADNRRVIVALLNEPDSWKFNARQNSVLKHLRKLEAHNESGKFDGKRNLLYQDEKREEILQESNVEIFLQKFQIHVRIFPALLVLDGLSCFAPGSKGES